MQLSTVSYYKSLNRPFLVCGVDREIFYCIIAFCLPIAISAHFSLLMDSIALAFFSMLYSAALIVTRRDPQILLVFRKHLHYKKTYAAIPGIHARPLLVKPSVPFYHGKKGLL